MADDASPSLLDLSTTPVPICRNGSRSFNGLETGHPALPVARGRENALRMEIVCLERSREVRDGRIACPLRGRIRVSECLDCHLLAWHTNDRLSMCQSGDEPALRPVAAATPHGG